MSFETEGVGRQNGATQTEEWRRLAERVCASPQFRKAARMRELFQFLVDRAIAEPNREISEYEIAARVFGRGTEFNPTESNVVRVGVRQLRTKLKEYFDEFGQNEPWLAEIPKGGYDLRFRQRGAPAAVPKKLGAGAVVLWGAGAVLLAAAVWAVGRMRPEAPVAETFLGRLIEGWRGPVQVVATDSAYILIRRFGAVPRSLDEYESGKYTGQVNAETLPPQMREIWQFLLTRQYTNVADVNIAYRLASDLHPAVPVLRIARHMRARDFRNGNFVILGSDASNPWHQLFVEQLNFRFHPEPGANSSLRNLYPRAGEPERYMPAIPDGEESFGLIAMVPNTTGTGKVVLIAGLSMEATEACGDFVLRRETRGALLRALGVASEAELDRFEVVVRTTAVAGTGRTAQVIASRRNAPPAR